MRHRIATAASSRGHWIATSLRVSAFRPNVFPSPGRISRYFSGNEVGGAGGRTCFVSNPKIKLLAGWLSRTHLFYASMTTSPEKKIVPASGRTQNRQEGLFFWLNCQNCSVGIFRTAQSCNILPPEHRHPYWPLRHRDHLRRHSGVVFRTSD